MRGRLILILGSTVAAFALLAAALPWWLGAALAWVGPSYGLTFARYERIGYHRFALHEAAFRPATVSVTASRIEADTPLVAWWRRGELLVGSWSVEVSPRKEVAAAPAPERGWVPLRENLRRSADRLDRWTSRVSLQAGVVRWPGTELGFGSASWAERALAVSNLSWRALKADVTLAFPADRMLLTARGPSGGLTVESRGPAVKGEVTWWDQRAELGAQFGPHGWLPLEAVLRANDVIVPGDRLRIGEAYATVQGRGEIAWRAQGLRLEVAVTGNPVAGKSVPPLEMVVHGHGDAASLTIDVLDATLPGIAARLSEPATWERSGKFRPGGARFTLDADLAKLPWLAAKGTVTAEAQLAAGPGRSPVLDFQLAAREVALADWTASLIEARGRLDWPRLEVSAGTLAGTAGERLQWHGGWDFAAREITSAQVDGEIRSATVARWLPTGLAFKAATLTAEAAGPVAALRHRGHARADGVTWGALQPLAVMLAWDGQGAKIDSFTAEATAGTTTLAAGGTAAADGVQLSKLALAQDGVTHLRLAAPADLRWRPALQMDGLHLVGPDSEVLFTGAWGETGRVEATVKNFSSAWLAALVRLPGPAWQLNSLAAKGAWQRGPMTYSLKGNAALKLSATQSAVLVWSAEGDQGGLRLGELSVVEGGRNVVTAIGRIPLRLSPAAAKPLEFEPDGALALDLTAEPHAGFWPQLAALTGIELQEPEAVAHLKGTWAHPQGEARVKAARVALDAVRFERPMPVIEALEIAVTGTTGELRLEQLTLNIEGQALRAQGRLPVGAGKWREFLAGPWAWAQRGAEGRLEVPDAAVAALARFLPAFVAPKGRLTLDVRYEGGALGGSLQLEDAATRPLGPLGVLQDINAEVVFAGRQAELRAVTAQSGGQTVTLSGKVGLPDPASALPGAGDAARGGALQFDVALRGENLPLVRQTGVLVRGDVDLKLESPASEPPLLSGTVRLRDSLFLSDIRALLPGRARTKSRTPPYFAVEAEPYAAWRLAVLVQGERFLKLRTALFNGVASARFELGGTLGEPTARGEANIDEGVIKLPFATFAVQEGRVTLTPELDIEPQVWVVGTGRRLSHDLRMEASGPASEPEVRFSSSPPMESGQVLLMVMAGEAPRDGAPASDRQRMARLGAFLGQGLVTSLGGESDASERLSISTGENVSRQGRETYDFEYRLGEAWSLVGEYDEFDEFNAGVKWRVFSRGGTKEEGKK